MKISLPLYAKIVALLTLNLLLVLGTVLVVLPEKLDIGWRPFLTRSIRERLQVIGETIAAEIGPAMGHGWQLDLQRFDDLYEVDFSIFDGDGALLAGHDFTLPREVVQELKKTLPLMMPTAPSLNPAALAVAASGGKPAGAAPTRLPNWPPPDRIVLMRWLFVLHPPDSDRYWIGIRTPTTMADGSMLATTMVASTGSFWHAVRFLDLGVWVDVCLGAVGLSILFWTPMLWGFSSSLRRLIGAAGRISNGHFDSRVVIARRDELGSLAKGLNTVSERLDNFLQSQQHFLANIAHEVSSPLGRLQVALEILQQHVSKEGQADFREAHEEVQIMSELVAELLAYSRVGIGDQRPPISAVSLGAVVASVLDRERNARDKVMVSIPRGLQVHANSGLLARALGNLVRNAVRYAGTTQGPIQIFAHPVGKTALIQVLDRGPGVPELALLKLGDPFYRPELARRRQTGGIGLGLATVKNCISACGGKVTFKNRDGGGFEAEIVLPLAGF